MKFSSYYSKFDNDSYTMIRKYKHVRVIGDIESIKWDGKNIADAKIIKIEFYFK